MKQFWAFIKIEFFHIFRDRRTMLILLGMPVLQIILFGFAITTELNHSRVAVLDPSKDAVTTRITERIDENRYFSVVKELSSASDIETVFRHDEADIVVAFTPDFDANLSTGHCRASLAIRDAIKSHRADPSLVQSSDEERLQFRTRRDGVDTDADLCDDDFHFHCTRERDRYDGSPVGVAHPAYFYHSGQGRTLLGTFLRQSGHDIATVGLRAARAGGGQPLDAVFLEPPSDCGGSVFGIAHFMRGTKPSGGHDCVGYGTDDACHVAFRHDFSHREHAGRPAVDFQYHSGKVVHTGRKEGDDRRLGHGRRMA